MLYFIADGARRVLQAAGSRDAAYRGAGICPFDVLFSEVKGDIDILKAMSLYRKGDELS